MSSLPSRSCLPHSPNPVSTKKSQQRYYSGSFLATIERRTWVRSNPEVPKKPVPRKEARAEGIPEWAPAQSLAKGRPQAFDDDGLYESWQGVSW